jgi:hypothetical protein
MTGEMTSARASELLRGGGDVDAVAVYDAWTEWLYGQYGDGLTREQLGKVYGLAWDHGHSAGLEEVGAYFEEFAGFAREILAAG